MREFFLATCNFLSRSNSSSEFSAPSVYQRPIWKFSNSKKRSCAHSKRFKMEEKRKKTYPRSYFPVMRSMFNDKRNKMASPPKNNSKLWHRVSCSNLVEYSTVFIFLGITMLVGETFVLREESRRKKGEGNREYENFEVNLEIWKECIKSESYGRNSQTNTFYSMKSRPLFFHYFAGFFVPFLFVKPSKLLYNVTRISR